MNWWELALGKHPSFVNVPVSQMSRLSSRLGIVALRYSVTSAASGSALATTWLAPAPILGVRNECGCFFFLLLWGF